MSTDNAVFDFIIVGAGSAGCLLANRLSANPAHRVLLLEAGGANGDLMTTMPAAPALILRGRNRYNWSFISEPMPGMKGHRLNLPRGRGLGGSSAINGLIYIRGNRADYDLWTQMGLPGWSYDDVLPYFRRSERYANAEDAYHGVGGSLDVRWASEFEAVDRAFVEAAIQAGHVHNADFNGAMQEGVGRYQVNIANGRRCGANEAFLKPVMRRPNLQVLTGVRATRILLRDGVAHGVEYAKTGSGKRFVGFARREVLLCAGVFQSPQLLQLSGIGDPEVLQTAGVQVLHPLPGVGRNLQDHVDIPVVYKSALPTMYARTRGWRQLQVGLRYLLRRDGIGAGNGLSTGGFVRSHPDLPQPDLQIHFIPASVADHAPLPYDGFTLTMVLLRGHSRGEVRIKSSDPFDDPFVQPNFLGDARDLEVLRRAVGIAREIARQPALAMYRQEETEPGSEVLDDWIRRQTRSLFHPACTCAMGPASDPMAVLDETLTVRGLSGLRVVDASAMPILVSGNTNAPTYMMAEKAADLILRGTRHTSETHHPIAIPA